MSVYDHQELRKRFSSLFTQRETPLFDSDSEQQSIIDRAAELALNLIYEAEDESGDEWNEPIEGMGLVSAIGVFVSCFLLLLATSFVGLSFYIWKLILG